MSDLVTASRAIKRGATHALRIEMIDRNGAPYEPSGALTYVLATRRSAGTRLLEVHDENIEVETVEGKKWAVLQLRAAQTRGLPLPKGDDEIPDGSLYAELFEVTDDDPRNVLMAGIQPVEDTQLRREP